jgi:hypothetical protein
MNFFGDQNESIRELSLNATKVAMESISSYGVKLILPLLLKGCYMPKIKVIISVSGQSLANGCKHFFRDCCK